ncbi:hypothetical protein [Nocardia sp. bgisy134]|uniref:hypothetical protein n=1 Tax=unclassified Nocardia TaxID=2637762 RepID=UPI003D753733
MADKVVIELGYEHLWRHDLWHTRLPWFGQAIPESSSQHRPPPDPDQRARHPI